MWHAEVVQNGWWLFLAAGFICSPVNYIVSCIRGTAH